VQYHFITMLSVIMLSGQSAYPKNAMHNIATLSI
jgi:hypothetical protein